MDFLPEKLFLENGNKPPNRFVTDLIMFLV